MQWRSAETELRRVLPWCNRAAGWRPERACDEGRIIGVGRRKGAPEAEHVAPSASLHNTTRVDRRRGQGGWAAEALTPSPIGAIRRVRRRRSDVRHSRGERAAARWAGASCSSGRPARAGGRWKRRTGEASARFRGRPGGGQAERCERFTRAAETPPAASTRGPRHSRRTMLTTGQGGGT
jgi:hypothetical protein